MWARNSPEVGFGERQTPKAREFFRLLRLRQAERRLDSPAHQTLPRASLNCIHMPREYLRIADFLEQLKDCSTLEIV